MIVMDYVEKGSLRKNLPEIVKDHWYYKLFGDSMFLM